VLNILGANITASGIVGGKFGEYITSELETDGIKNRFFSSNIQTRCCVNLFDKKTGIQSEFLEPGNELKSEEIKSFWKFFEELINDFDIISFNGSCLKGFDTDIYARLINLCKQKNIFTVLDTSGDLLKEGIVAIPDIAKPNVDEIRQLLGKESVSEKEVIETGKSYIQKGMKKFVVSLGAEGSIMITKSGVYRAKPDKIHVVNTVGCGDSMTAGLIYAQTQGMSDTQSLMFATKAAAANAMQDRTGFIEIKDFDKIKVIVTKL